VLKAVDDPARAARQLVREAKNAGGHDNVTVVVLHVDEAALGDANETPTEEHEPVTGGRPPVAVDEETSESTDAAVAEAEREPDAAAAETGQEPDEAGQEPDEGGAGGGPAAAELEAVDSVTARRSRRRLVIVLAVVAVLVIVLVVGAVAVDSVYYVGVDAGTVSVYHGLPWSIGGVKLASLYMKTTYPIDAVASPWRERIQNHDLHRKDAALQLARRAQGLP